MKFIYGGASFANNYHKKKIFNIKKKEKINIIKNLLKVGISKIDTSPDYGDIENLIGRYCDKRIKVDSKLPIVPSKISYDKLENWVHKVFFKTINNLKENKIDIYYFHDPKILLTKKGKKIFEIIKNLKKSKLICKIGISIYDPNILNKILNSYQIDAIQAPLNIFDNRILHRKYQNLLMKNKIILNVRSLFLQGLLIDNRLNYKLSDDKSLKKLLNWQNYIGRNKLNPLEQCISFIKMKKVKNVVIGANNLKELYNISRLKHKKNLSLLKFKTNYKKLIDPFRWSSEL